jgi:hypothetical protein
MTFLGFPDVFHFDKCPCKPDEQFASMSGIRLFEERFRDVLQSAMDNHGYLFSFWINMDSWLSNSDVCKYFFLDQILSDTMHIA